MPTDLELFYHQNIKIMTKISLFASCLLIGISILSSCNNADNPKTTEKETKTVQTDTLDYFNLRPKLEKDYGYSHAVKIGDDLKIPLSSMLTAPDILRSSPIFTACE